MSVTNIAGGAGRPEVGRIHASSQLTAPSVRHGTVEPSCPSAGSRDATTQGLLVEAAVFRDRRRDDMRPCVSAPPAAIAAPRLTHAGRLLVGSSLPRPVTPPERGSASGWRWDVLISLCFLREAPARPLRANRKNFNPAKWIGLARRSRLLSCRLMVSALPPLPHHRQTCAAIRQPAIMERQPFCVTARTSDPAPSHPKHSATATVLTADRLPRDGSREHWRSYRIAKPDPSAPMGSRSTRGAIQVLSVWRLLHSPLKCTREASPSLTLCVPTSRTT
jgi:hypothetical protein